MPLLRYGKYDSLPKAVPAKYTPSLKLRCTATKLLISCFTILIKFESLKYIPLLVY